MAGKKNKRLSTYWHGYRNAKIFALIYAIENRNSIIGAAAGSESYLSGLEDGFNALADEVMKLIDKDNKGGRRNK